MERLLKWIDELDDLVAPLRLHGGPLLATLLLLVAFVAAVGAIFLLGPPDLLASP